MGWLDKLLICDSRNSVYLEEHNTYVISYKWVCYRKGHQRRPKVSLREGSFFQGSHISISTALHNSENIWKNAKISHKARWGTQRSLLSSYLQELMWRQRFGKNPFRNIIEHITLRYPLH